MLRRTPTPPTEQPEVVKPEVKVTDVQRLEVVTERVPLSFDLSLDPKDEHAYKKTKDELIVSLGKREVHIPLSRIVYYETRPDTLKEIIHPK